MTREEIIRMAREAGAMFNHMTWVERDIEPVFQRFAALVEQHLIASGYRQCAENQSMTQHCGLLEAAVAAEREACAKLCDFEVVRLTAINEPRPALAVGICAALIRARGEQ